MKTGGLSEETFREAEEGSIFDQLYKDKFPTNREVKSAKLTNIHLMVAIAIISHQRDQYNVASVEEGLERLVSDRSEKLTFYYVVETVYAFEEYKCK